MSKSIPGPSIVGISQMLDDLNINAEMAPAVRDTSHANQLPQKDSPNPWWVPIGNNHETTNLVNAVIRAIEAAAADNPKDFFIDIAQLSPPDPINSGKDLFFEKIEAKLKSEILDTKKPVVIRYFEGCDSPPGGRDNFKDFQIIDRLTKLATQYENLSLYCGYNTRKAGPFPLGAGNLASNEKNVNFDQLKDQADQAGLTSIWTTIQSVFKTFAQYSNAFFPIAIGWNHAKIFAINKTHLVQGGANFWNDYLKGDPNPIDLATAFEGNAAVGAHYFCNYLWNLLIKNRFLTKEAIIGYRKKSEITALLEGVPSYSAARISPFGGMVVASNTLGMTQFEGGEEVFRDIIMNLLYLLFKGLGYEEVQKWMYATMPVVKTFLQALFPDGNNWDLLNFNDYSKNPYYIGRYARNYAMRKATQFIGLSQHKLGLDEHQVIEKLEPTFKTIITKAIKIARPKENADTIWNEIWCKAIFPIDSMMALASASSIDGMEIQIVCSKTSGAGYNDSISKQTYLNMISSLGGNKDAVAFKRTGQYNHSKLTIIDRTLFNVGSENFYPSYNQEFSLWVQEKLVDAAPPKNGFMKQYWDGFWAGASDA